MNQLPHNIQSTIVWLRSQLGIHTSLVLFGSQAHSKKAGSDYDIGIRHDGKLTWRKFCLLKDEAEERAWPYKIHLIDLNRAPKEFINVIERELIELTQTYGNK